MGSEVLVVGQSLSFGSIERRWTGQRERPARIVLAMSLRIGIKYLKQKKKTRSIYVATSQAYRLSAAKLGHGLAAGRPCFVAHIKSNALLYKNNWRTYSGNVIDLSGASDKEDLFQIDGSLDTVVPTDELRDLVGLQLKLLMAALEPHLRFRETGSTVRCAVYCRNPSSLASGSLQLQLIGATDGRETEAARSHTDLVLGIESADGQAQEAWIVDQEVIVLPDSGGLVLPLSHNGFLIGLLVVERIQIQEHVAQADEIVDRCLENPEKQQTHSIMPSALQPPACSIFKPEDMNILKQAAKAVAIGCIMDLRSVFESVGNKLQAQVLQGIVSEAKAPLGTLRTLSTMLTHRLQDGEPEKDMSEAISVQGERLSQLIKQLQTALSPSPTLEPPKTANIETGTTSHGFSNPKGADILGANLEAQPVQCHQPLKDAMDVENITEDEIQVSENQFSDRISYPALPSSSIGGDTACQWPIVEPQRRGYSSEPKSISSKSGKFSVEPEGFKMTNTLESVDDNSSFCSDSDEILNATEIAEESQVVSTNVVQEAKRTNFRLSIMPLLSALSKFSSVIGVTIVPVDENGNIQDVYEVPEVYTPVNPLLLKRIFGQLLDDTLAASNQGDCIEISFQQHRYQVNDGILITIRLFHVGGSVDGNSGPGSLDPQQLKDLAVSAGGWLDIELSSSTSILESPSFSQTMLAMLWLPTVI